MSLSKTIKIANNRVRVFQIVLETMLLLMNNIYDKIRQNW